MPSSSVQTSTALIDSVVWIEHLLLGSVGRVVAVLAIALLGISMLTGSVSVRRGGTVILGCFVLFSARLITIGIIGFMGVQPPLAISAVLNAEPSYVPTQASPNVYDPYAGASVPPERAVEPILR